MTRRALGEAAVAGTAALLASDVVAAVASAQTPPAAQRNWLAEARESRADALRAIAKVDVAPDVEPAFRFRA